MSYQGVVSVIRNVSEAVNVGGLFQHGRTFDASLNFSEVNRQIYLYPITATADLTNHFYEVWTVLMGFYFQDEQDSTPLNREDLIRQADEMVTDFLATLNEVEGVELSNARKEPQYRRMAGTYTGYALSFTLGATTDICSATVVYPNIPNPNLLYSYSELWTINEGDNVIAHNITKLAKFVTFLDTNNREVYFDWRNTDSNTITVNSTIDAGQIRINIIAYEN